MKDSFHDRVMRETGEKSHMCGIRGRWEETGRSESRRSLLASAIIATQEDMIDATCAELREQIENAHCGLCEILLIVGRQPASGTLGWLTT